jgi:xanthine/uracil permease
MEFLALVSVLVLGLVLGWMLGLDSGKKSVQESEKAYWLEMVRVLESDLHLEKAKAKARESVLGQG